MTLNEKAFKDAAEALFESFKKQDSLGHWEHSPTQDGATILDGTVDLVIAVKAAIEAYETNLWRPIAEFPPEMEPVVARTEHGTLGIAYIYKLGSEHPQWNFIAHGMNATGKLNDKAFWCRLPTFKLKGE